MLLSCYSYIEKHYVDESCALWDSVRRELRWVSALLPLLESESTKPWDDVVTAFDAAPWGLGVMVKRCDLEEVKAAGRTCERWRFRVSQGNAGKRPRQHAFEYARFEAIDKAYDDGCLPKSVIAGEVGCKVEKLDMDAEFPEVSGRLMAGRWIPAVSSPWKHEAKQVAREAAAGVVALRRQLRGSRHHGKRLLGLTDSMPLAIAVAKGRSSTPSLRQPCRSISALQLASGCVWNLRWLPSEFNPADDASRGRRRPINMEEDLTPQIPATEQIFSPNTGEADIIRRRTPPQRKGVGSKSLGRGARSQTHP